MASIFLILVDVIIFNNQLLEAPFSVYFLRGRTKSLLSPAQQAFARDAVLKDPYSDSFMLFDSQVVRTRVRAWREKLPWIRPYYAVKSNPLKEIIKIVLEEGAGLDCASAKEIKLALECGASVKDIVFSNVIKSQKDIFEAGKLGIELTVADTIAQAQKIKYFAPNMKFLWRISVHTADSVFMSFSKKFGDDLGTLQIASARFKQLAELGFSVEGIHFHCGSDHRGTEGYYNSLKMAEACIKLGREAGHPMRLLDIGGGFPSGPIKQSVLSAIAETKKDLTNYSVVAEPGRHFSSDSCHIMTRVIGKRIKNGIVCYHINQSVYHTFNNKLTDDFNLSHQKDQLYGDHGPLETAHIFGMTCDGIDVIAEHVMLPQLQVGDWLCFAGMGAYTLGSQSQFNGMKAAVRVQVLPFD